MEYEPRSISDHHFEIKTSRSYIMGDWKRNPFWLEVIEDPVGGGVCQPERIYNIKHRISLKGGYLGHSEGVPVRSPNTKNVIYQKVNAYQGGCSKGKGKKGRDKLYGKSNHRET